MCGIPRHEAQNPLKLLFEKDFDQGQLTVAFNEKKECSTETRRLILMKQHPDGLQACKPINIVFS